MKQIIGRRFLQAAAFCAVALSLCVLVPGFASAAEGKPFAVINSDRIVQEYGALRDAQEQYAKFVQDIQRETTERQRDLIRMDEEIDSQKLLLGEDALAARLEELENLKAEYYEYQGTLEAKAEAEYNAKIKPFIDQVTTIAERIGKEEGWGIIIDSAALTTVYIDDGIDLTDKVLAALVSGGE